MRNAPTISGSDTIAAIDERGVGARGVRRDLRRLRAATRVGRDGRVDRDQQRDAGGAGDLLHGADDGGAVRVEAALERGEGCREQRRERHREAEREQRSARSAIAHTGVVSSKVVKTHSSALAMIEPGTSSTRVPQRS